MVDDICQSKHTSRTRSFVAICRHYHRLMAESALGNGRESSFVQLLGDDVCNSEHTSRIHSRVAALLATSDC
eukprot:COSAG06_NODE_7503_length_2482_cov_2.049937_2_plen_72_part_00